MRLLKLALLLIIPFVVASQATAQESETYKAIIPAQPTSTEGKIEVVEIFSYGCSHCYRFETMLERWLKNKPDNVEFVQLPAIFTQTLALYARAFYAAEALGVTEKIHTPFFEAIHVQKRRLNTEESIIDFFAANGVDKKDFQKAFRSFSVDAKMRRAADLGKRYGVQSTPSMVVNGKYITDPGMKRQDFRGMINTVNKLIEKESNGG